MKKREAVIIRGNPKYVTGNEDAERFYTEIQLFLESLGYVVRFDSGEPYTVPPKADLWVGHSRGADRLRFADAEISTVALGSSYPGAINHPLDNTKESRGASSVVPNTYHYVFTQEMRKGIEAAST